MEWAEREGVWQEVELQTELVSSVRMELDYQIVAGMGMNLLVEADSDTAVEVAWCQSVGEQGEE